jgi:energy-coupling factor transport system permease protein
VRTWARESTYSRLDAWVLAGGALMAMAAVAAAVFAGTWRLVGG